MNKLTSIIHPRVKEVKTGSIISPIHLTTVFGMATPSSSRGFQYGRVGNPTRQVLEEALAVLFEARKALVFSSGVMAISMIFNLLKTGDEVICHSELYEGTTRIFDLLQNSGIKHKVVDLTDPQWPVHITSQTKMVFFETPTNPTLEILPIQSISHLAHEKKLLVVVDNTMASPILQQPLTMGADIVVESLTKSIGGHSDVIGGVVALNDQKLQKKLRNLQITLGGILSPFDSFLLLRSLKTLELRVKCQQKNADQVRRFLRQHPKIRDVFSPSKHLFLKQMNGRGFIVSFKIIGDSTSGLKFLKNLQLITIGHSFGGVETLIQQPASMMNLSNNQKKKLGGNFFRLSVGLEDVKDIINDLKQALKKI